MVYYKKRYAARSKTPVNRYKKKTKTVATRVYGTGVSYPNIKNVCATGIHPLRRGMLGESVSSKLTYFERRFSLNPGAAGVTAAHIFAANGLYDPNVTGTGHQPMGYDQMMLFFVRYNVVSAKIFLSFKNSDTTEPMLCGVYKSDATTIPTDPKVIVENGLGVYTLLSEAGAGDDKASMELYIDLRKFFGPMYNDADFSADESSNPLQMAYFQVWAATQSVSSDGGNVFCSARIEYYTNFYEPKQVSLS